jgi:hypothetical protein
VICEGCGASAPVLKTVRWRTGGERRFVLCGTCHPDVAGGVWIVPGPVPCFGFCPGCSNWFPVGELSELRSGGWKWDAPSGLCRACSSGAERG